MNDEIEIDEETSVLTPLRPGMYLFNSLMIGFFMLLILVFSFVIKYPDVVIGKIVITTNPQPVPIRLQRAGTIHWLIKGEDTNVKINQPIGYIHNSIPAEQIFEIEKRLLTFQLDSLYNPFLTQKNLGYGELEGAVQQFITAVEAQLTFVEMDRYKMQEAQLRNRLQALRKLESKISQQTRVLNEQRRIGKELGKVDSFLYTTQTVAYTEYLAKNKGILDDSKAVLSSELSSISNEVSISQIEGELVETQIAFEEKYFANMEVIRSSHQILIGEIQKWRSNYLITSPMPGIFKSAKFVPEGSQITPATDLGYVLPQVKGYLGKITIQSYGVGKIKEGDKVRITLNNYPADTYGYVNAIISSYNILPVEKEGMVEYEALIEMPTVLVTSFHKTINYQYLMNGKAEIITRPYSLGERIVSKALRFSQ